MPGDQRVDRLPMRIDDRVQRAQLGEIADEVFAPGPAADHGDAHIR